VLEVGVAGAAVAGGECAGAVTDLDEVAELAAGLVAAGLVAVVAVVDRPSTAATVTSSKITPVPTS
jgi:hypothetical protein